MQEGIFDEAPKDEEAVELTAPLAARMRPRTLDEFVGQEHLLGPGEGAPAGHRVRPDHLLHPLGTAGHWEDHARTDHRSTDQRPFRRPERGFVGRRRPPKDDRGGSEAPSPRPADHPPDRRDPPLQQVPAGCRPARRRAGRGHAHRRDHREPELRGQLRAPLALPRLYSPGARRARDRDARPPSGRRPGARSWRHGGRAGGQTRWRGSSSSRTATPGGRSAGSSSRRPRHRPTRPDGESSRSRRSRTRCSAEPYSTTRRASSTTT